MLCRSAIYGRDVQDVTDDSIPCDVQGKILTFANAALAAGQMRGKSYVGIGGVSMGIMGSCVEHSVLQKSFGVRTEWVDMSEVNRRVTLGIFDQDEYARARLWFATNCPLGFDKNPEGKRHTGEQIERDIDFTVTPDLICSDLVKGNPYPVEMRLYYTAIATTASL